jgi:uracil-DNA glycosylase
MPGDIDTNRNLLILLGAAQLSPADVHLTNAVLCIKQGSMDARVLDEVQRNCMHWLGETIRILQPQAVAALGANAWKAICAMYKIRFRKLCVAAQPAPEVALNGMALFARFHCGSKGTNRKFNGRAMPYQIDDWRAIGNWLLLHPRAARQ